ncbi:MAG TPA: GntR family transcriptional regulator [Candidatus Rifleibacterium sp.]|nr:GntR family transcriptional regulator [Candidatus Rifleibacterium sp.]
MLLRLNIDNRSEAPIYRQISEQIAGMIRAGRLKPGEHLPPERELALQLRIARGTVKKAYEALVHQHYIVAARGKGSTVTGSSAVLSSSASNLAAGPVMATGALNAALPAPHADNIEAAASGDENNNLSAGRPGSTTRNAPLPQPGRSEAAGQALTSTIINLEEMGLSYRQIKDLFAVMLEKRQEEIAGIAIAAVDCNPEALGIYQKQLSIMTHKEPARIMLDDLRHSASAAAVLEPFDLILTTSNHVEELQKLAPTVDRKVVGVIVSPTQATLIAMAKLEKGSRAGVIYQSARFFEIIRGWLQRSEFQGEVRGFNTQTGSADELNDFVADRTVLIVPPGYAAQFSGEKIKHLNRFRLDGGLLIDFEYQIERGSLLHLEELIRSLSKTRK